MTTTHTVPVKPHDVDAESLGYFRFGPLADGFIVTTETGKWHHLDADAFSAFLKGEIAEDDELFSELSGKGFLRDTQDLDAMAGGLRARKRFVGLGPSLHVIHLVDEHGTLSVDTAKHIVDHAMLSTASAMEFRFLAGDRIELDTLKFIHQYATEKNRYEGKTLTYRVVSSLAELDEEATTWLIDKRFGVHTTFDGPAGLHDAQRDATGAAPHATLVGSIGALHEYAGKKRREGWMVEADVHVGAANASDPAAVLAALDAHGVRRIRLRPLLTGPQAISAEAFSTFYEGFLAGLIEAAAGDGERIVEGTTGTLLHNILQSEANDDVEIRSPSGLGLGQLVYDTQGHMFPSETARTLSAEDGMFLLGEAGVLSYQDCVTHPTLRTLALASLLETLPGFADDWATPFVGVDPVEAYAAHGDLFPRFPTSEQVGIQRAQVEILFSTLLGDDEDAAASLRTLAG